MSISFIVFINLYMRYLCCLYFENNKKELIDKVWFNFVFYCFVVCKLCYKLCLLYFVYRFVDGEDFFVRV